ncbi:MAG: Ldh family oxidoreductase [Bacteroidota bacterium]
MIPYEKLLVFTQAVLEKTGLDSEKSKHITEILVEGELLGHRTHGLQLLADYVRELEGNLMEKEGDYVILNDFKSILAIDGKYLPGPYLVNEAIEQCIKRVEDFGLATVTIQRCHHIACLAAYLEKVTKLNYMILIAASDPRNKTIAPFGGMTAVYSPNPWAIGIPTKAEPILIDISMSVTSNALVARSHRNHEKLPHKWLLDQNGEATDDPSTFFESPPSTILPLGGMDVGYKGFGLGLMVEALTNGLGGHGRSESPSRWGCSVFIQIIDPQRFGGVDSFLNESEFLKNECLNSKPADEKRPIRMPGIRGLELKKQQLVNGVELLEETENALIKLGSQYDLNFS